MAAELVLQSQIEFEPASLPPGLLERVADSLRAFLADRGLGLFLGGFGGCRCIYGFVHRCGGDATLVDRDALEAWLRSQPITCKVAIADPEPYATSDINRRITSGRLFEIDNLSAVDRQAAAKRENDAAITAGHEDVADLEKLPTRVRAGRGAARHLRPASDDEGLAKAVPRAAF